ncbi:MAG: patatin-like phospholipase family protein [Magnetospirillum gryphiswaldense]|nr:patatin-like phospholipase family protein [Magnetospirillum gryphiswaldense]
MADDYQTPAQECDVVMKGGITSGIVYPKAVLSLARQYRFRDVGGASAGAIAAAITAAAEYGRASGGFEKLAKIPTDMSTSLATLFQPDPRGRALYGLLADGFLDGRWGRAVGRIVRQHWLVALVSAIVAVAVTVWSGVGGGFVAGLLAALLGLMVVAGAITVAFLLQAMALLPKLDFGLCPGRTQPGNPRPALSDWLARTIEDCAGRLSADGTLPERPLTFGDLADHGPSINLRAMTTDLSMRRPYTLPFMGSGHFFKEAEFRRLFGDWVVDALIKGQTPQDGYYRFPQPMDLPVVVAVRMSLSFPLLIAAVPLYRVNYADDKSMQRLLFSDGGLSSNFPIHLFDSILPGRPTFGISLDDFDPARSERRVRLPMPASRGRWLEARSITSLADFAMGLLNAAKDWQDNLQTLLPGYRERVVHVYLKPDEGGLNLTMPPERIEGLVDLGGRAGALMAGEPPLVIDDAFPFNFNEHRWRRYLVAYASLEALLTEAAQDWGDVNDPDSFAAFIKTYMWQSESYKNSPQWWKSEVFGRMEALMDVGRTWENKILRHQDGAIPYPRPVLRMVPHLMEVSKPKVPPRPE